MLILSISFTYIHNRINKGKLDQGEKKEEVVSNAFNKFRQMDSRGQENNDDSSLPTTHQNTIK